jgi:type III secretory pathway component EscS
LTCIKSFFKAVHRANGYYSSFTYFASKILFDILPLRVVPPILFGGIVYGLVGLVPTVTAFWKFILTLVLFNLTTASAILLISVACESISVANLIGTLVMLFKYASSFSESFFFVDDTMHTAYYLRVC